MSAVIERFLICDFCGNNHGVDNRNNTIKNHRQIAKESGWIYLMGKDYCDTCWNKMCEDKKPTIHA